MANPPFDSRSVSNLLLEVADDTGVALSNLALQKLLYFAHALHLVENKLPLVDGYFEAWQYGPVHPTAYRAFKSAGDRPITFRAERQDPLTGLRSALPAIDDRRVIRLIRKVLSFYGSLTPGRLVDISHARDAPWDFVVSQARSKMALGLRIADSVILDRFKFHKVSVGLTPTSGEPGEDSPFA